MTRAQQTAVYNQAKQNSAQDQGNAQTALTNMGGALTDYNAGVQGFVNADPYKAGGEYAMDQSNINAGVAHATSASVKDSLDRLATRSGTNTAGYAPALTSATENAILNEGQAQARSDADRLNKETAYQAQGVEMRKFPVTTEEGVYNTSLGSRNTALGTAGNAASGNKSFGDVFGQTFATDLADNLSGKNAARFAGAGA